MLNRTQLSVCLFAHGHVKMFLFFPVCDIPLRFISLNVVSSAPIGRIYRQFFSASYWRKKCQFSDFLEGKGYVFMSCLYSKLGNGGIFELIDGTQFI